MITWLLTIARCWAKIESNLTVDSSCVAVTTLPLKYAFCKVTRSTLMPHSATSRAARANCALPGFLRKSWPVCRNPINLSLNRTGTAMSHSPTGHVTVRGSWVAFSQSRSCACKHAEHAQLFCPINDQHGNVTQSGRTRDGPRFMGRLFTEPFLRLQTRGARATLL